MNCLTLMSCPDSTCSLLYIQYHQIRQKICLKVAINTIGLLGIYVVKWNIWVIYKWTWLCYYMPTRFKNSPDKLWKYLFWNCQYTAKYLKLIDSYLWIKHKLHSIISMYITKPCNYGGKSMQLNLHCICIVHT